MRSEAATISMRLDVFDVLASLVDKSLVLAEPEGDALRYRLLESTRAYACEKLDDAGERDLIAGRHLRYLRDRFAQLRERYERTARYADLVAAQQTELDDVRSALDGALARSEVIDGGELLANVGPQLASHRTRCGRHGTVRGVSRSAPGGPVAATRSAVNRVVLLARLFRPQGARI